MNDRLIDIYTVA